MYFEQHRGIETEHGKQSESVLGYQSCANLVYQSLPLPSFLHAKPLDLHIPTEGMR